MAIAQALFSSEKTVWETPGDFFQQINKEFNFELDAAASERNAKCKKFFDEEINGLNQVWQGRVFCNPPYGKYITPKWVKKAYEEWQKGNADLVVLLIPARTDTRWFHEYIYGVAEIRFIKSRLHFELNGEKQDAAPFPSMLVIYKK